MSMRRIALETYRTGEEFAKLQKEKDEFKKKQEIEVLFKKASEALKAMCAKNVTLLRHSSVDSYATSVPGVIFLNVDDEMEVKAVKAKDDVVLLYVLSGGVYKQFSNLTELGKILHEDEQA